MIVLLQIHGFTPTGWIIAQDRAALLQRIARQTPLLLAAVEAHQFWQAGRWYLGQTHDDRDLYLLIQDEEGSPHVQYPSTR